MRNASIIVLAIMFASFTKSLNSESWTLEKDKNEIKIWTNETEGSTIKSFRAKTRIKASVKQLAVVLNDVEAYPEWMSDVSSTKILDEINENERFYYFEIDAPWPVSNRDNIIHFHLEEDSSTKGFVVKVEGHSDYIPVKDDIVRIQKSIGSWSVIPVDNEMVEVEFQYTADPGGNLPSWAINMLIVDGPFTSLSNLKDIVKEERYKD